MKAGSKQKINQIAIKLLDILFFNSYNKQDTFFKSKQLNFMKSTNHLWRNSLLVTLIGFFLSTCTNPASETSEGSVSENADSMNKFEVIAYYTGEPAKLEDEVVDNLTQIIFSFLHLNGNKLQIDNAQEVQKRYKIHLV